MYRHTYQGPDHDYITWRILAPGWNFNPTRASGGLKLYVLASTPNMKLRAKSLRRIKIVPRTRIVHCFSRSLAFCWRSISTFWDGNSLQWWWNWNETCFCGINISQPEWPSCVERRDIIWLQARRVHGFSVSPRAVQPCLDVLIFHLSFEIRETK